MASISTIMASELTFTSASNDSAAAAAALSDEAQSHKEVDEANATTANESSTAVCTVGATVEGPDGSPPTEEPFDAELARLGPMPRAFLVSEGIVDVQGFLSCSARFLAPALSKFVERKGQRKLSPRTAESCLGRWKRNLRQRRETLKEEGLEDLHPVFEVFDVTVRSFFASKSIVDPHGLLKCQSLHRDWVDWWLEKDSTVVSENPAKHAVLDWRQSVKEQVAAGAVTATASNENALDLDELARLGPMPREFLVSQGIKDVTGFLFCTANDLALPLSKFMVHNYYAQKKISAATAENWIYRWKRNLRQRRETLKEGLLEGLDPAFEVFNEEVRSFLADMKITKPQDLLGYRGLGCLWMAWRLETSLTEVNENMAHNAVLVWRKSVKEQVAVGPEVEHPVKRRRRKRKVAIRTSPWLLLNVSTVSTHSQECTDTPVAANDAEYLSDNSPPTQKRTRTEKGADETPPSLVGASTIDSESIDDKQK